MLTYFWFLSVGPFQAQLLLVRLQWLKAFGCYKKKKEKKKKTSKVLFIIYSHCKMVDILNQ